MHILYFLTLFFPLLFFGQSRLPSDSLKLIEVNDLMVDDYGNIYTYKTKDFSFTKYDSLGKQLGKMMMTVPFRVQSVQNPLNIVLFSENSQEVRLVDHNLNDIQRVDLKKHFGFVQEAYIEDQQIMWLLDDSSKRLIQYNFRDERVVNSFVQFWDFDKVVDLLVFEGKVYLLTEQEFVVRDLKGEVLYNTVLQNGKRLRRENDRIYAVTNHSILLYHGDNTLVEVINKDDAKIVDKNSKAFFEVNGNNLYLYTNKIANDN